MDVISLYKPNYVHHIGQQQNISVTCGKPNVCHSCIVLLVLVVTYFIVIVVMYCNVSMET